MIFILEFGGKPIHAGQSFSATHIVGYFDTIEDMHKVYDRYKGHTALSVDGSGWRLVNKRQERLLAKERLPKP